MKSIKPKRLYNLLLGLSICGFIFGLLYVSGTVLFNDPTSYENPGNIFAGFTIVPIFVLIPFFFIKVFFEKTQSKTFPLKYFHIVLITLILACITTLGEFATTYNYFVRSSETIDKQYSIIDITYQKRFDLIPNIARTVKAYSQLEQNIISQITDARQSYIGALTADQKVRSVNQLDSYIRSFIVTVENYPNIKSDQLYIQLIEYLAQSEEDIISAKKTYNEEVAAFNKNYKMFPYIVIARYAGFSEKEYLKSDLGTVLYNSKNLLNEIDTIPSPR